MKQAGRRYLETMVDDGFIGISVCRILEWLKINCVISIFVGRSPIANMDNM
jgi:hypothetical protein